MIQYITAYVDDKGCIHTVYSRTQSEAVKIKAKATKKGYQCSMIRREIVYNEPLVLYRQTR